jgi:Leucine-rich repeat (LRR) protein
MPTDFKICEIGASRYLLLQGPWEPVIADVMQQYGVRHLRLNRPTEQQVRIDFLRELGSLERLELSALSLADAGPLYDLPNLRRLAINGFKKKIDFTRIPKLEELRLDWHEKSFSSLLEHGQLRVLGIGPYTRADLLQLKNLRSLEELVISFSRIERLAGVEHFPELRQLSVDYVKNLETLEPLESCRKLWNLSIDGAKILRQIDPVSSLRDLQELCLKRCPEIESLRPIKSLPALRYIGLLETTNLKDGDLSVLLTLPQLRHASFADRKHYSHKSTDFPKVYRKHHKLVVLYDSSAAASRKQAPEQV